MTNNKGIYLSLSEIVNVRYDKNIQIFIQRLYHLIILLNLSVDSVNFMDFMHSQKNLQRRYDIQILFIGHQMQILNLSQLRPQLT